MAKRLGANRRQKLAAKRAKRKNGKAAFKALGTIVLVGLVGVSAALGARKAVDWAARAEIMRVENVVVRGAKNVDSTEVLAVAGVEVGASLLGIKSAEIRERLGRNAWISRVRVQRLFPGKVTLRIIERTPVALVNLGRVYQVDAEGVLLPLTPGECTAAPVLSGLRDTVTADSLRRLDDESLERMDRVLATLRGSRSAAARRVCQVRFGECGLLELKIEGSPVVTVLEEERLSEGIERLERLMRVAGAREDRLRYVNLCYDNRAYVR